MSECKKYMDLGEQAEKNKQNNNAGFDLDVRDEYFHEPDAFFDQRTGW